MNLTVQFQHMLATPKRVPIRLPDHRQVPESEYIETICDAIELADDQGDYRVILGAIGNVKSALNRSSLREMLRLRFDDLKKGNL